MTASTETIVIDKPVIAIIMFGPPSDTDGFRLGAFYQCTIDPQLCSPSGEYIRFDQHLQHGELHGWQRVAGITVCEILAEPPRYTYPESVDIVEGATVTMKKRINE